MITKRLVAMVAGTVSCALSVGFIMEHSTSSQHPAMVLSNPDAVREVPIIPAEPAVIELPSDAGNGSVVTLNKVELTSLSPDIKKPIVALALESQPEYKADDDQPTLGCAVTAEASVQEMASVELMVKAPCHRNERLTIHHKGLMFTEATDAKGELNVTVPALSENAVFIIDFDAGSAKVVMADVPDLREYDRVAIQWSGAAGLEIHAREFGADYGDRGHAWSGSTGEAAGFVTRLGDPGGLAPRMVEIYTYPTGTKDQAGTVSLSVEAEVTLANCGRDISAQTLELQGDGTLRTREMELAMPNCTAIGDFLVLNNLLDDLKIAAK